MKRFLLFSLGFVSFFSSAQMSREISYGVFAGGIYSKMGEISTMIIPSGIYENYSTTEKGKTSAMGGVFINWKYPDMKLAIQPELYYSSQNTDFNYNDINGFNYTIGLKSNNLNAGFLLKYYPFEGFYIGAGSYFTFNLNKDQLTYTSNGAEIMSQTGVYFEPDALVQKVLKESLEGKDYFHAAFSLGYEFDNGLNLGARYHLGLGDAMETLENGHRFKNTNNKVGAISLQIGYRFTFDGSNNF